MQVLMPILQYLLPLCLPLVFQVFAWASCSYACVDFLEKLFQGLQ